ncbi:MAG: hypothetical protein PF488_00370 [Patescibacteria group bacterium]|jgi:hypothetical protein|nr:hypothetical protein [Patescibacteria group bacterium]
MRKTFLDELVGVIDSVNSPGYGDPAYDLMKFLAKLPGAYLIDEKILPKHIAVKGIIIICSSSEFARLNDNEKERMKIKFEFRVDGDKYPKDAEVHRTGKFQYAGEWAEIVEMIVDNMSPGDKLMSLGIRKTNFFSYN